MAATADDILSVAEMKTQLRLPVTHISDDAFISSLIDQAISHVSNDTGLPLLDVPYTAFADIPDDNNEPMVVEKRNFYFDTGNTEHEIDVWTSAADLGDSPDGSISRAEIGRRVASADGNKYFIYLADSEKWPEDLNPETRARIKGSLRYSVPDGLVPAIVVLVRFLYSGNQEWPSNPAYRKLINPFRRLTPMEV